MSEGKKYDEGKLRWNLLPIEIVEKIVEVYEFGANKYGENTWQNLSGGQERCYAALLRHLCSWRKGDKIDDESGLNHLQHCIWNLMAMLHFEPENKKKINVKIVHDKERLERCLSKLDEANDNTLSLAKCDDVKLLIHKDKNGVEMQLLSTGNKIYRFDASFFGMYLSDGARGEKLYRLIEASDEECKIAKEILQYPSKS